MLCEDKALKLTHIFIVCDDFCNALTDWQAQQGTRPTCRAGELTDSEMLAITIFYHYSGAKCFQYYYQDWVEGQLTSYFPNLISYERFVARMPRLLPGLYVLLNGAARAVALCP
jgi:hypothetical protein